MSSITQELQHTENENILRLRAASQSSEQNQTKKKSCDC